ncbi:uncharacterized protein LOC123197390 isoform X1 [Mangifera indica]|uniref:uncharacterized protein LOC123197390 isoform X1 n=1 Tax=Mangifera indica TaxID=29780 RepID=UPI001CF93B68|nr:uncharacterized protein LOC123197390 isoform X1 [Mangifera indica]
MSSNRHGPPKHQNRYAWKPNAGVKINEKEVGGKLRPYSEITGVCQRCKEQIDWKRRYGKYKPLTEPAKCQSCSKRAVRQAYHSLCSGCAKEQNVCAKCRCRVNHIVGRDLAEVEAEQKMLEEAIKNARERDRRTLLRAHHLMNTLPKAEVTKAATVMRMELMKSVIKMIILMMLTMKMKMKMITLKMKPVIVILIRNIKIMLKMGIEFVTNRSVNCFTVAAYIMWMLFPNNRRLADCRFFCFK